MKNIQNKLFLTSIAMLAVIFMTSGCEFESAGEVSKDVLYTIEPTPAPPSCADGIDNDGDGLTDDADLESCDPNGDGIYDEEDLGEFYYIGCNDDVNNDATGADGIAGNADDDTLIDLDDPDCLAVSNGGTGTGEIFTDVPHRPLFCEDGLDNDLDGTTDLEDPDCEYGGTGETPTATKTNCDDDIDNDGDGDADLEDSDCLADGGGEQPLPNCADGIDQDGDDLPDLLDPDCLAISNGGTGTGEQVPAPEAPAEPNCEDGIDNDGDGLTDDADTESCDPAGGGETYLPNCNDGIDQDEDGFTDLDGLDPDCLAISNGGTGTGEFIPISIPEEVGETNDSGEELANSVPEDATPEEAAALIEDTPAGDVIDASTNLTDPTTEDGAANAAAVEQIETALVDDLAGGAGTGLTDPVTVAAFTNSITETISETGELPPALESNAIDELLADVAEDPVLAELLASFDIGGRGSGPPVSPPQLYKSFGTQGYEECLDECSDAQTTCSDDCYAGVNSQYTACTANANSTNSECSASVASNFTACDETADAARTSCRGIVNTVYDDCLVDLEAGAAASEAACIATNQGIFDNCETGAGSALESCNLTASINKTSCDQAALDQNAVNVNTAMEQFNLMMAMSTSLLANPALAGYATFIQTVALCNFMNNIMVGVNIKDASLGDCSDSQGIENGLCTAENTGNLAACETYLDDSGCYAYDVDPANNSCLTSQTSQLTGCDTQYTNNVTGCTTNQNNGNTNCSAALTTALDECSVILSGLDCGYCNVNHLTCSQNCHAEFGTGGG